LAPWQSEEIVFAGEMGTKAQAGAISDAELWRWVGERLQLNPSRLTRFRQDFWAGDVLDIALVDYIQALRPRYQTAIISNATDTLRSALEDDFQIADAFDLIVVSAEEKVMKPDAAIYRRTLERLGRSANECVFIDDNSENIAAASDMGINTIYFQAGIDVPALLAELGVRAGNQLQVALGGF